MYAGAMLAAGIDCGEHPSAGDETADIKLAINASSANA